MEGLGAHLMAISPETPDNSLTTREKHDLPFDVLFDQGNKVADAYGLAFSLHSDLRPLYKNFGIDIQANNGDDTFTLPIPATYVIAPDGRVAFHFADADYTKRIDPEEVVEALKKL